jgi:SAM-dependent methyltransferase
MKLNLGSGGKPLSGYMNVDKNPRAPAVDVICDLDRYPWPFRDESAHEIVMAHCLEHLVDHNRGVKEIHRILVKGGVAKIEVPHFTWQLAYQDPTHKHFFGYHTFSYYCGDCGYFDFQFSRCRARLEFGKRLSLWNHLLEPVFNRFPDAYEQSPLRMFPALCVHTELVK